MTHEKIYLQGDRTKDKAIKIKRYFEMKGVDPSIIAAYEFETTLCYYFDKDGLFRVSRYAPQEYVEKIF